MAGSEEAAAPDRRLGLAELTAAAGVSVRTVRYYVAEGLLPPPAGGGPASHYTAAHLDRLRLIARLKASYLPLREIRRRLAGLDETEVRRLLATDSAAAPPTAPADDASAYLDRILGGRAAPVVPPALSRPEVRHLAETAPPGGGVPSPPDRPPRLAASDDPDAPPAGGFPSTAPILGRASPAAWPVPPEPESEPTEPTAAAPSTHADAWRRVPLGDDAELLIREEAYRRRRDRVDWLVAWARKVFG